MNKRKEFGDFQTPYELACRTLNRIAKLGIEPEVVIEPTAGIGAFLQACGQKWGDKCNYRGYEINPGHVKLANERLRPFRITVMEQDFFTANWKDIIESLVEKKVLVVGNPPWVTNTQLGVLESTNLPAKSNLQKLKGLDALTGKSNFDIAEWIISELYRVLPEDGAVAMLCKTATARKVLLDVWKQRSNRCYASIYHFDARREFDVAVDACLLILIKCNAEMSREAIEYRGLEDETVVRKIGFSEGKLVADIDTYRSYEGMLSISNEVVWRSGVKHDASKVMEFTSKDGKIFNGFGEEVEIEDTYIYPLLKSSDLGNQNVAPRKEILITQTHPGENTSTIATKAPKTWEYLCSYRSILNKRRSSIYKNRPEFSIFGVGTYSFSKWKVAISGLYKSLAFSVIPPQNGQPVMLDDTCYFLPCKDAGEAHFLCELLQSELARDIISSLVFIDSKRPITSELLKRLSLYNLAVALNREEEFLNLAGSKVPPHKQALLPFAV